MINDKDKFIEDLRSKLKGLRDDLEPTDYYVMDGSRYNCWRIVNSIVNWIESYEN